MQEQTVTGFRISPHQRRLWKLQQENPAFRAQCAIQIEGRLNPESLSSALQQVVARHEILRTTFYRPPGLKVPFQVIGDDGLSGWRSVDVSDLPPAEQQAKIEELFNAEGRQPFNFEEGPLLRLTLVKLAEDNRLLLVSLPALCADAWTLKNLVQELGRFYEAAPGREAEGEEPFQYADFAEWQYELLETEDDDAAQGRAYWTRQNLAAPFTVRLPLEGRPDGQAKFEPDSVAAAIPAGLAAQIDSVARQHETSTAAFLLACWQTLLWRLSGEADIPVGHVCDGRKDEDLQGTMGLLARWLPVKSHFEGDLPFSEVLWQVDRSLSEGYEWQDYFAWEESLGAPEDASEAPLGFEFVDWPGKQRVNGVAFSIYRQQSFINRFKLMLSCARSDGQIAAMFHYDPALFRREDVQRLAGYFVTLVRSAGQGPETPVSDLEILTAADREQLLVAFNQTAAEYPQTKCIHQLFEEQVDRTPNAPAVVFQEQQLSYAELNAQANRLAHHLRGLGVGPDVRVGLCVDRSLEMMVGLLGVLKAGGAYVPLNPEHPKARLAHQLAEIEAPVLLAQAAFLEQLPERAAGGEVLCLDRDEARWANEPATNPEPAAAPHHLVYVIYTSGSTGLPKGVAVTHRNLVNYSHFICRRLGLAEKGALQFATVSTITADLGNTSIFPSLISGGCLHILGYDVATDGGSFARYLARHPIDVLKIVPSHLSALLASQPDGNAAPCLPRQYLILGGEALSFELLDRILPLAGECEVINHYGPTETTVGSLTGRAGRNGDGRRLSATAPIGRPIANTEIYILDERQRPAPIGLPGELYIGGHGVSRGYLNQPERTAERFVAHPFSADPQARLYRTGDLVRYLPGGEVEFLGRTDHQVKIRGFRIELEEIEVVLGRRPGVRQAVVLAREPEHEQGHKRLVAYVVPDKGAAPTAGDLQAYLREELPDYMVPSAIVLLDAIPLTPNGKVDRKALPAPEQAAPGSAADFVAPRNSTEQTLAEIWAQVLGREQVGIHDNFFTHLGGDSILSIQIIARASQAGLRIVPRQIFEYQTIAELAPVVGATAGAKAEQGLVTGPVPLTPIQRWFVEEIGSSPDPHHWNQAILFEMRQRLDFTVLERVVQHLLLHHDALRLRFERRADGWRQVNAGPDRANHFSLIDLSALPEDRQGAVIEAAAAEVQASLDLAAGPLLRFVAFDLGADRPGRLLIVIHHLVVDGVSWRILLEDLQAGYQQLIAGGALRLPPKSTSFKAWAERLAAYAQAAALREELDYWLDVARQRVRRIPVDFPGGTNSEATARSVAVSLSAGETEALLHQVPEVYHTQINDVLLTAVVQAFSRWTGGRSLLVDLEGHGREELFDDVDVWRTVGWFTTHMPVLLQLGGPTDPGQALMAIKEQLRAIPKRGIGYGLLRYLSEDEDVVEQLRALPQPEVAFNYLGQFDQVLPESSPLAPARESVGPLRSPRGKRSHLLYVSGSVSQGCLQLACVYGQDAHRRSTIEQLVAGIAAALRELIAHCQSGEAGGFTPSDFTLAGLEGQEDLDKISSLLSQIDEAEEEMF